MSKNYKIQKTTTFDTFGNDGNTRLVLGDMLGLTGTETSVNLLPAGVSVPFLHKHTLNEELYIILTGNGTFFVDGDEFAVTEGDFIKIDPAGLRVIKAGTEDLRYICIQSEAGSLTAKTEHDGIITEDPLPWK